MSHLSSEGCGLRAMDSRDSVLCFRTLSALCRQRLEHPLLFRRPRARMQGAAPSVQSAFRQVWIGESVCSTIYY